MDMALQIIFTSGLLIFVGVPTLVFIYSLFTDWLPDWLAGLVAAGMLLLHRLHIRTQNGTLKKADLQPYAMSLLLMATAITLVRFSGRWPETLIWATFFGIGLVYGFTREN